jgi:hypothetical protein
LIVSRHQIPRLRGSEALEITDDRMLFTYNVKHGARLRVVREPPEQQFEYQCASTFSHFNGCPSLLTKVLINFFYFCFFRFDFRVRQGRDVEAFGPGAVPSVRLPCAVQEANNQGRSHFQVRVKSGRSGWSRMASF